MYKIKEVAKLAGITTRTLRYYDEINLLKPKQMNASGYRVYDDHSIDRLQQIILYKKLGFELDKIKDIIDKKDLDIINIMHKQVMDLELKKQQLDDIIHTIKQSIKYRKGEINMSNQEKFKGLKENDIKFNEERYGREIRNKYGDKQIDESNDKYMGLSKENYEFSQNLGEEILVNLKEALAENNPKSELAQHICRLHQDWIKFYWPTYDEKSHLALVEMYLEDERFKSYYDVVGEGATKLLVEAMRIYLKD